MFLFQFDRMNHCQSTNMHNEKTMFIAVCGYVNVEFWEIKRY